MAEPPFASDEWAEGLANALQGLVTYERQHEDALSDLLARGQLSLGVPQAPHDHSIRDRVSRYVTVYRSGAGHDSTYEAGLVPKLTAVMDVLLEHPVFRRARRDTEGRLVVGVDLAFEWHREQPVARILEGLGAYALEHTPQDAAQALEEKLQSGERGELTGYEVLLFRGLHADSALTLAGGISLLPFAEVRGRIREHGTTTFENWDSNSQEPVGALVHPVRWGPTIVPEEYDFEGRAHDTRASFRADALLLVDLLAITHGTPVRGAEYTMRGDDEQLARLLGLRPSWWSEIKSGRAGSPTASPEATREVKELFEAIETHEGGPKLLRVAISRMSASLARSGPHAPADRILDIAIALEIMYGPIDAELRYKLATRAAYFLGETGEERQGIYAAMTDFYRARSRIVHGTALSDQAATKAIDSGFDIARRTLKKLVMEGAPAESSDWDQLVVAGGAA